MQTTLPQRSFLTPTILKRLAPLGTWCSILSLVCLMVLALLTARSLWTYITLIPLLLCTVLGFFSPSRGYVAFFVWTTVAGLITPQATALFYLSQAQNQQTQLLQQQVVLLNLFQELEDRQVVLHSQVQQLNADVLLPTQQRVKAVQITQQLLTQDASNLAGMHDLLAGNTWRLQQNSWSLPTATAVDANQQAIEQNALWLRTMQPWLEAYTTQIAANLKLLPPAQHHQPIFPRYPLSCDGRQACTLPSWQASFSAGWNALTSTPLTTTWPFWLWLATSLISLFVILPRTLRAYQECYCRVLFHGPLRQAPGKLPAQVENWAAETQLVTIGVWRSGSSFWFPSTNHEQDRLSFALETGTVVTGVYATMRQAPTPVTKGIPRQKMHNEQQEIKASYEPMTHTIVVEPGKLLPPKAVIGSLSHPPLMLYINVEWFTGNLTGSASIAGMRRLLLLMGSPILYHATTFLHWLNQLVLFWGCYLLLVGCSYAFFDGGYPPLMPGASIIGILVYCALQLFVLWGRRRTTKVWQVVPPPPLWSMLESESGTSAETSAGSKDIL